MTDKSNVIKLKTEHVSAVEEFSDWLSEQPQDTFAMGLRRDSNGAIDVYWTGGSSLTRLEVLGILSLLQRDLSERG